jgi:arylsulfatase A-like enzyme
MPRADTWSLALILASACSGSGNHEEMGERMNVERVHAALLSGEIPMEVLTESPGMDRRFLTPLVKGESDTGPLPALVMPPPCEVRFDLPSMPKGARLSLAAGLDASAYEGSEGGTVRMRALWKDKPVLDERFAFGSGAPREERAWRRRVLEVRGPGSLVLSTAIDQRPDGDGPPPSAGFALLQVTVPIQRQRAPSSPEHPNLVLICIDTLRADRLHAYGNPRPVSRNLDALASRGTLFENAYAPTPWTWPSTASLLTSLSPPEHGLLDVDSCYLAEPLSTLAEICQEEGISTAGFSCNPLVSASRNFSQGFERFEEYDWTNADPVLADVRSWVEQLGSKRFFAYLHLTEPHRPYEPAQDLAAAHAPAPPAGYSDDACRPYLELLAAGKPFDRDALGALLAHRLGLYDAEIATIDRSLGAFWDWLRDRGLEDRTVIAVTSDHGEEFAEHGMLGHGKQLFDESLRVPLILAGPGVRGGVRVDAPVENRWLAGTLLRLLGIQVPDTFEQVDLLDPSHLRSRSGTPIFFTVQRGQRIDTEAKARVDLTGLHAVQSGPWRLMHSDSGSEGGWTALYNLAEDPAAMEDRSGEEPELVERLRKEIETWWRRGESVRPSSFHGGAEALRLLSEVGYIDAEGHAD